MPDRYETEPSHRGSNVSTEVQLAEIQASLRYMSRDMNDIKTSYIKAIDELMVKVDQLESFRDRTEGSIKTLARAQAILYIVFSAGFVMGIYVALHGGK